MVSLFASGSEVAEIPWPAQKTIAPADGVYAYVVSSVPSARTAALEQDEETLAAIIGEAKVNVAIEAAVRLGWDAVIGRAGIFIGMKSFGASAPAKDLYKHFGITADAAVSAVKAKLKRTDSVGFAFSDPAALRNKPFRGNKSSGMCSLGAKCAFR